MKKTYIIFAIIGILILPSLTRAQGMMGYDRSSSSNNNFGYHVKMMKNIHGTDNLGYHVSMMATMGAQHHDAQYHESMMNGLNY